jgi:hypothetical protein
MSQHDEHDNDCEHGAEGGGPDTRFLDFELHKVMYSEAESIVRESYRELLKDAVKQRLQARWGARITALAELAADEAMADADANFEIQARIEARNAARRSVEDRIQAILADEPGHAQAKDEPGHDELKSSTWAPSGSRLTITNTATAATISSRC